MLGKTLSCSRAICSRVHCIVEITRNRNRKIITSCLFLVGLFTIVNLRVRDLPEFIPAYPSQHFGKVDQQLYVKTFPNKFWQNETQKKILFWTPFFGKWDHYEALKRDLTKCKTSCLLTNDKSDVYTSNAVLFHENDMWKTKGIISSIYQSMTSMPSYRRPDQVWILFSIEPIINSWGSLIDLPSKLAFNWTSFYRTDSTIPAPYGKVIPMSREEIHEEKQKTEVDYSKGKNKLVAILVSNCQDDLHRYRIIRDLQKYLTVDTFGKCSGKTLCLNIPDEQKLDCMERFLGSYKFYLAFENSFCRDYITEKFWNAVGRKQIPIIIYPYDLSDIIPPGSYLNLFDFPSIKHLAERILEIDNNDTLYNSFFQWKKTYRFDSKPLSCKICEKLQSNTSAQVYTDIEGWMTHDSCQRTSASHLLGRFLDSISFNLGLS